VFDPVWIEKMLELQRQVQACSQEGPAWPKETIEAILQSLKGWGIHPRQAPEAGTGEAAGLTGLWGAEAPAPGDSRDPQLRISETAREITVTAWLPGIKDRGDISVKLLGDTLFISGVSSHLRGEIPGKSGSFRRCIRLPVPVEHPGAQAVYQKNGVLTISFMKKTQALSEIEVAFS